MASAACHGRLECLRLLLERGADPNLPNAYGSTALHDAAYHGQAQCVCELLDRGATVDPRDANGSTPLVAACATGHAAIVRALLEHGAVASQNAFGANRAGNHTNQAAIEANLLGVKRLADSAGAPARTEHGREGATATATSDDEKAPLPPGSIVSIGGLKAKPELNGSNAIVEGDAQSGRLKVAVPLGAGKALRVSLSRKSLAPMPIDSSEALDPRELPKWPGLECGESVLCAVGARWGPTKSLVWCFQQAMPPGAKAALSEMSESETEAQIQMVAEGAGAEGAAMLRQMLRAGSGGNGADASNLVPHAQWLYSLWHMVHNYLQDEPEGCFRFLLAHADDANAINRGASASECLIIDILSPALACPRWIPTHTTSWAAAPKSAGKQTEGHAASAPLIHVRFMHVRNDDKKQSKRAAALRCAGPDQCAVTRAALAAKGYCDWSNTQASCISIKAESSEEIRCALSMLETNRCANVAPTSAAATCACICACACASEAHPRLTAGSPVPCASSKRLSAEYDHFFNAASAFHGSSQFKASFLVPPPHPTPSKGRVLSRRCAGCSASQQDTDGTGAGGKFQSCSRCGTHLYCSPACQKAHWTEHKKVCNKSLDELRAIEPAGGTRPSLLFSTLPPAMLVGKYMMHQSHQGAATKAARGCPAEPKPLKAEAPLNYHGTETFIVKVQPPGATRTGGGPCGFASRSAMEDAGSPWACMVYDELRSLENVYLPLDTPGIEELLKLIRRDGIQVPSGACKAFCEAVREGSCLRIFVDRLAPQQTW